MKLENKLSNEEILKHSRGYIRSKYKASEENDFYKRYSRVAYGLLGNNAQSLGAKKYWWMFAIDTLWKVKSIENADRAKQERTFRY